MKWSWLEDGTGFSQRNPLDRGLVIRRGLAAQVKLGGPSSLGAETRVPMAPPKKKSPYSAWLLVLLNCIFEVAGSSRSEA